MLVKKIAKRLKYLRQSQNLSEAELAALLGVSRQYVWKIENGKRNMSVSTVDKFLNALNTKPSDFYPFLDK